MNEIRKDKLRLATIEKRLNSLERRVRDTAAVQAERGALERERDEIVARLLPRQK